MKHEIRDIIELVLFWGYVVMAVTLGVWCLMVTTEYIGAILFMTIPLIIIACDEKEKNEEMYEEFYYYLEEVCE